jgi:hypothetical protein
VAFNLANWQKLGAQKKRLLAKPFFYHRQYDVLAPLIPRQTVPEGVVQSVSQHVLLKGYESQGSRSQKYDALSIV